MADDDEGNWRNSNKHRMLYKHEGKLLSKDDFFYMTANSGNTPSPREDPRLEVEETKNSMSKLNKKNSNRNLTPPLVEYCETD